MIMNQEIIMHFTILSFYAVGGDLTADWRSS